jgi:type IV fimbrial biogenesis protein FimT
MNATTSSEGLTLVELLVIIALLVIFAASAIPSLEGLVQSNQRTAAMSDLLRFLASSRRYAVMTGNIVTVCPVKDDGKCGQDWNTPVFMFEDPENERVIKEDTKVGTVLNPPKYGRLTVRSLSKSYFQFRPNGFIYSDLGNITWCADSGSSAQASQLIISRSGRIRIAKDTNGDGIVEDAKGQPVKC